MKKLKILFYVLAGIVLIVLIAVSYISLALPDVGKPENINVNPTAERIKRGEYLVNHVTLCVDCHSKRDWSKFAGPMKFDSLGAGGELFDAKVDFPGEVFVPNITSYHLKDWTDGELFRAITCGVRKNGDAIFPLMPWPYYAKMSREDIYSMIAYLRTLKPLQTDYPKAKLDFPLSLIVHIMPKKENPGIMPSPSDTLNYGAYLVTAAACKECHSQSNNGNYLAGLEFAGGRKFKINGHVMSSSNITPDMTTGIGSWTANVFVSRFKSLGDPAMAQPVSEKNFQTIMPWYAYEGMSEGDLKAMYAFLRTLKPVKNQVVKFQQQSAGLLERKKQVLFVRSR